MPAVRWTISEASASSRLASRASSPPSAAEPISRSGASVARATQAPSRSAAQSCDRAPKGTTTGPSPSEPPASASRATSQGACSRTTRASPSSGDDPASIGAGRRSPAPASRTMSSPRRGEENAAVLAASPAASSWSRRSARADGRGGQFAAGTTPATISSCGDSEAASGSARRSSGSRPYSARGTIRSARSATGRSDGDGPSRDAPAARSSPGSWRRIACSRRFNSSLGSSPSSSESSLRAAR